MTAAYTSVQAASTVVAFFLGFDINRMTTVRDSLFGEIAKLRIEVRKSYFLTGKKIPIDLLKIEDTMIRDALSDLFHPTALLLGGVTLGLSSYFLFYAMSVASSQGAAIVHPLVRDAGTALQVLQVLGIVYHLVTAVQVRHEIQRKPTIISLLSREPSHAGAGVEARDKSSKEQLDLELPDWSQLLSFDIGVHHESKSEPVHGK